VKVWGVWFWCWDENLSHLFGRPRPACLFGCFPSIISIIAVFRGGVIQSVSKLKIAYHKRPLADIGYVAKNKK
jgi:hypothetical protein